MSEKENIYYNNTPFFLKHNFDYSYIEDERKLIKKRTMTLISSGKYKNKTFLMVDSIATLKENGEKHFHFRNKLKKLKSTKEETYFCLTGVDGYQYAIELFDEKCYWDNENFDIKNTKHIEEIISIFDIVKNRIEYNAGNKIGLYCRIYFINKNGVYYYTVNDKGSLSVICEIPNNTHIEPNCADNLPILIKNDFKDTSELIDFHKEEIIKVGYYNFDLKNKISYVIFDDEKIIKYNSIDDNKEMVLSFVCGDFSEIEQNNQ